MCGVVCCAALLFCVRRAPRFIFAVFFVCVIPVLVQGLFVWPRRRKARGVPLYSEMFEGFDLEAELANHLEAKDEHVEEACAYFGPCGQLEPRGIAKHPMFQTTRSAYKATLLQGQVDPVTTGRSVLSLGRREVLPEIKAAGENLTRKGLRKYEKKVTPPITERALAFATQTLLVLLSSIRLKGEPLSEDEMLNGLGTDGFKKLDISTSPGSPFKYTVKGAKKRGKRNYVNYPEGEDRLKIVDDDNGAYLREQLEIRTEQLKLGMPDYVAECALKDEILPLQKLEIAKTRIFNLLPLEISLLTRKYFGGLLNGLYDTRTVGPCTVGVNALGADWTDLARTLDRYNGLVIAGDFKLFDGQLYGPAMMAALDVINTLYTRKGGSAVDNNIRRHLVQGFIHTDMVCGAYVIRKSQGIPSGVPITAQLNSLTNFIYMASAVFDIFEKVGKTITVEDFNTNMVTVFYGDDFILAPSAEWQESLDFFKVQEWFGNHNITITPEDKNGVPQKFKKLFGDVTFLKRRFVQSDTKSRVLAPLELETIKGIGNWCKRGDHDGQTDEGMQLELYKTMLSEYMHYGREIYEINLTKINKVILDNIEVFPGLRTLPNDYLALRVKWEQGF